jgi:hypothetical protein
LSLFIMSIGRLIPGFLLFHRSLRISMRILHSLLRVWSSMVVGYRSAMISSSFLCLSLVLKQCRRHLLLNMSVRAGRATLTALHIQLRRWAIVPLASLFGAQVALGLFALVLGVLLRGSLRSVASLFLLVKSA